MAENMLVRELTALYNFIGLVLKKKQISINRRSNVTHNSTFPAFHFSSSFLFTFYEITARKKNDRFYESWETFLVTVILLLVINLIIKHTEINIDTELITITQSYS